MGAAYRASGRTLPIMDGLAFHPYADSSGEDPGTPHPRSTTIGLGDYDRLIQTLAVAFDGTAQARVDAPDPVRRVRRRVEDPGRARQRPTRVPSRRRPDPVDEATQGQFYGRALQLAFCQPNVVGILLFHSQDEAALTAWQSGVYYADGTPKTSLYAVRDALARARGGSIARCEGLGLEVTPKAVRFPTQADLKRGSRAVRFRCSLDCAWELRASGVSKRDLRARISGYGRAGLPLVASLKGRRLGRGDIVLSLTTRHPVNPGEPRTRTSPPLRLP